MQTRHRRAHRRIWIALGGLLTVSLALAGWVRPAGLVWPQPERLSAPTDQSAS